MPGAATRREGIDNSLAASRECERRTGSENSLRQNDRTTDDHGLRPSEKADTVAIAAIEARVLSPVGARILIEKVQSMLRQKVSADSNAWIASAGAKGVAVYAAITQSRSIGQTDGQITNSRW